jgi:hypothetical protein
MAGVAATPVRETDVATSVSAGGVPVPASTSADCPSSVGSVASGVASAGAPGLSSDSDPAGALWSTTGETGGNDGADATTGDAALSAVGGEALVVGVSVGGTAADGREIETVAAGTVAAEEAEAGAVTGVTEGVGVGSAAVVVVAGSGAGAGAGVTVGASATAGVAATVTVGVVTAEVVTVGVVTADVVTVGPVSVGVVTVGVVTVDVVTVSAATGGVASTGVLTTGAGVDTGAAAGATGLTLGVTSTGGAGTRTGRNVTGSR